MKSSVLAGSLLAAAFAIGPALAAPETAETDPDDDPMKVEGMTPEESEQQLEPTTEPVHQAHIQARVQAREQEDLGRYLTNQDGMSLYIFMRDEQGGDYSTCYESCAIAWPPYTTVEPPTADDEVDADRLGMLERENGTRQVTFDGWPLYFFARDVYPGDALGQGRDHLGGHWYLISPEGEVIEDAPPKQAEPAEP